jgi:hypothetical protein
MSASAKSDASSPITVRKLHPALGAEIGGVDMRQPPAASRPTRRRVTGGTSPSR